MRGVVAQFPRTGVTDGPPGLRKWLGDTAWMSDSPLPSAAAALRVRPRGSLQLGRFAGAPVYVHWTSLSSGLMLAALAHEMRHATPGFVVATVLGCIGVVLLHEAGHAIAARRLGLAVYRIELKGGGGVCYNQAPRTARETAIVHAAGMAAQLALLLCVAVAAIAGVLPQGRAAAGLLLAATVANGVLLIGSALPTRASKGLDSDGSVLWQLFQDHRRGWTFLGAGIPAMAPKEQSPVFPSETPLLTRPALVPKGFRQGIEVLNDATTPLEFVVQMLTTHLGWAPRKALFAAIEIHNRGGLVAPLPALEAERVAAAIADDARTAGHALVCRAITRAPPR